LSGIEQVIIVQFRGMSSSNLAGTVPEVMRDAETTSLMGRKQDYDSIRIESTDSNEADEMVESAKSALGSRVRNALVALSLALFLFLAVVSTSPTQRASMLSRIPTMNFKQDKHALTTVGELANTPPPSPSVITYTYRPTSSPTEEKADTLPSKKQSKNPEAKREGTHVFHDSELGNTPPPSPSVVKYTYQPTKAPTEETSEDTKDSGIEVEFETTDNDKSSDKDKDKDKKSTKKESSKPLQ